MKISSVFISTVVFVAIGYSSQASAWGPVGHETVAYIAEGHMSATTKKAVDDLLGRNKMAADAPWADKYRLSHKETAGWHFIDIPIPKDGASPETEADESKYCKNSNCVVDQINADMGKLKDPKASKADKKMALMFLIHFVGDVHQPLHCANDDDRGGNEKYVLLKPSAKSKTNGTNIDLHAVWDRLIEVKTKEAPKALAATLDDAYTDADVKNWQSGTPADWAMESYTEAIKIYAPFPHGQMDQSKPMQLPADYYSSGTEPSKMRAVVNQRLEQAGVRLAWLLDQVFENSKGG